MNGIKMSDCRFYVNEEERTVICVIPNTRCMLLNWVRLYARPKINGMKQLDDLLLIRARRINAIKVSLSGQIS